MIELCDCGEELLPNEDEICAECLKAIEEDEEYYSQFDDDGPIEYEDFTVF